MTFVISDKSLETVVAFLAVFSATQENGLSETLSFEEILGLSFGKMLEFLRNFIKNLHFRGKF